MHPLPRLIAHTLALMAALVLTLGTGARAESAGTVQPQSDGPRMRIAYYQGGEYVEYASSLLALVNGLVDLGWVTTRPPEDVRENARALWQWLTAARAGDRIEFVKDAFYDAGWDSDARVALRLEFAARVESRHDLDAVLALGTWAGQDLANDDHSTPVLVISSSDAIGAGIVKTAKDSGRDHVHAHLDPSRVQRQLRLFHGAVGFRRLGVAYENTPEGRIYAGLTDIEALGRELGFAIEGCHTLSDDPEQDKVDASVISCAQRLMPQIDALYLTEQGGVNERTLPQIVQTALRHRVPTFSMRGSEEVRHGILLSMARAPAKRALGRFYAATLAMVLNGKKPRDLRQMFAPTNQVAINMAVAKEIGFIPKAVTIALADKIFQSLDAARE